jgi:hypothetical protein
MSGGVYLACNRQVERLMGASEAEIVGKPDYDFFASTWRTFSATTTGRHRRPANLV